MKIQINYNTISYKTEIECSDVTIQNNLQQTILENREKRITLWFESFITRIKEELNNDPFSIKIIGCDEYEENFINTILERENEILIEKGITIIKDSEIQDKYEKIDGLINYLIKAKDPIVENAVENNIKTIKDSRSKRVDVPVIATMSSGKSTLLNALIGQDLLYEDSGAATATTCTIKVNNGLNSFKATAFQDNKKIKATKSEVSRFLEEWNFKANEENQINLKLELEGPVENLNTSNFELNFIDTPGPNSAKYQEHKEKTFNYIKDNQNLPIVLYVLDPEKIDSKDDDVTLKEISDFLYKDKETLDRIVFVYNKIDREDLEKKSIESILNKVICFLKKYKIENPKIFPVSAKYAKLSQMDEDTLTRSEKGDLSKFRNDFIPDLEGNYNGFQLLEYSPLTLEQKKKLKERLFKTKFNEDLLHSGIAAIKLYIEDYIINHHKKNQYKNLENKAQAMSDQINSKIELELDQLEKKTDGEKKIVQDRKNKEKADLEARKSKVIKTIEDTKIKRDFISESLKKIENKFDSLKDDCSRGEKMDSVKAKDLIIRANEVIDNLRLSIKTDFGAAIDSNLNDSLNKLKNVVKDHFTVNETSVELQAFSFQLFNEISSVDIVKLDGYKKIDIEKKETTETKEVISTSWLKRFFGLTDTVEYKKVVHIENEFIDMIKFWNEVLDPISQKFYANINRFDEEINEKEKNIKTRFKNHLDKAFNIAMRNTYSNIDKEFNRSEKDSSLVREKLNKIADNISKFQTIHYNENLSKQPAIVG